MEENPENKKNTNEQQPQKENNNMPEGYGIASLICGVLSFVLSIIPLVGIILAILAIVFYFKQKKSGTTTMSIVGLVFGIIGLVISLFVFIAVLGFQLWFSSYQDGIVEQVEDEAGISVDVFKGTLEALLTQIKGWN